MALVGKNFVFFHIPRTGGTWVRAALKLADPGTKRIGLQHCFPADPLLVPYVLDRTWFTVVREFESWYDSYKWMVRGHLGRDQAEVAANPMPVDGIYVHTASLRKALPGIQDRYTDQVDVILHMENLMDEVAAFLNVLGYDGQGIVDKVGPEKKHERPR